MLLAVVSLAVSLVTRRPAPAPGPGVKQVRPRYQHINPPCGVPAEDREQRHRAVLRQDSRGDQEHDAFQRGLPATLRCVDSNNIGKISNCLNKIHCNSRLSTFI